MKKKKESYWIKKKDSAVNYEKMFYGWSLMAKLKIISEYMEFLKENNWWLLPIVFSLLLLGLLLVLTKGSAIAPFIYTLF